MGDRQVASPILRRPARFGLAASDRGYAGCELRRILLPRMRVNKARGRASGTYTRPFGPFWPSCIFETIQPSPRVAQPMWLRVPPAVADTCAG